MELRNYLVHVVIKIFGKKENIYNKVSSVRMKLLQTRQHLSSTKNIIGVSSEPYLDLISNQFNQRQWNHLSLGKIFSIDI